MVNEDSTTGECVPHPVGLYVNRFQRARPQWRVSSSCGMQIHAILQRQSRTTLSHRLLYSGLRESQSSPQPNIHVYRLLFDAIHDSRQCNPWYVTRRYSQTTVLNLESAVDRRRRSQHLEKSPEKPGRNTRLPETGYRACMCAANREVECTSHVNVTL